MNHPCTYSDKYKYLEGSLILYLFSRILKAGHSSAYNLFSEGFLTQLTLLPGVSSVLWIRLYTTQGSLNFHLCDRQ